MERDFNGIADPEWTVKLIKKKNEIYNCVFAREGAEMNCKLNVSIYVYSYLKYNNNIYLLIFLNHLNTTVTQITSNPVPLFY